MKVAINAINSLLEILLLGDSNADAQKKG